MQPSLFHFNLQGRKYHQSTSSLIPICCTGNKFGNTFQSCPTSNKGWQECDQPVSHSCSNASGKRPPLSLAPPTPGKHHLASVSCVFISSQALRGTGDTPSASKDQLVKHTKGEGAALYYYSLFVSPDSARSVEMGFQGWGQEVRSGLDIGQSSNGNWSFVWLLQNKVC